MTLIVPMYHRASAGRHGNAAEMLDAHFAFIARHCRCVMPGEAVDPDRLNVCLTFDDAYIDFYAIVYPLLLKHGLKAVLAVPVAAVPEHVDATMDVRMEACAQRLHDCTPLGAHCSWSELEEMGESGSVSIASHGLTHAPLEGAGPDLQAEIVTSKAILSHRLGRPVDSFVLPYGRFDAQAVELVRRHYRYVFRIGSADNRGWSGRVVYRVDADGMTAPGEIFSKDRLASYRWRRRWNALRRR